MIELLSSIFAACEYVVDSVELKKENFIARLITTPPDSLREEYFLIIENLDISDELMDKILSDYVSEFFDILEVNERTDKSFRKNCTMILCCESNKVSSKQVLKFEEDPFIFKKNIVTYSHEELASLVSVISESLPNVGFLNELVRDDNGSLFEKFKNGKLGSNSYYPLLLRIITKLSIIHYIPNIKKLDDLNAIVKEGLSPKDFELMSRVMDMDLDFDKDEDLLESKLLESWE